MAELCDDTELPLPPAESRLLEDSVPEPSNASSEISTPTTPAIAASMPHGVSKGRRCGGSGEVEVTTAPYRLERWQYRAPPRSQRLGLSRSIIRLSSIMAHIVNSA